ncbi:MAG: hypothetical protein ACPGUD_09205 [Parashewanella sp.]
MDYEYAYNFWRSVFESESSGAFSKNDFDKWFSNGSEISLAHFPVVEEEGSKVHFNTALKASFISMLEACADGRFGK